MVLAGPHSELMALGRSFSGFQHLTLLGSDVLHSNTLYPPEISLHLHVFCTPSPTPSECPLV